MADDVLTIDKLDDGKHNGFVEWVGLDGALTTWELAGDIYHDEPRFLESKLWNMGL